MKKYFRMVGHDSKGNKRTSNWFDMKKTNVFDIMKKYETITKTYKIICNIEYKEA